MKEKKDILLVHLLACSLTISIDLFEIFLFTHHIVIFSLVLITRSCIL